MNLRLSILTAALLAAVAGASAQRTLDIDLWPDGLPNSNGTDTTRPYDDAKRNFKPSVRVFLPEDGKATGTAVVCCPGGGYWTLATGHEGYDWADFFNSQGIALIVLKYRMPNGNKEVPMSDAAEALRLVRAHADDWKIDPKRVGIMGSSAGGHLASTMATHMDSTSAPAFQILFYPVISLDKSVTHMGTREGFLGQDTAQVSVDKYSGEKCVSRHTPPAIMLLSDDDRLVPSLNSVNYYAALREKGVSATLHIYPSGGHGWGCKPGFAHHKQMLADLTEWIRRYDSRR